MVQPAQPAGATDEGIIKGLYRYAEAARSGDGAQPSAQLLASGVALPWAMRAQQLLAEDWNVAADVWSVTSWTELRRDAMAADSEALLHPDAEPRTPWLVQQLAGAPGPVIASSDWMRAVPDQIAPWVPSDWASLGTDGFGMSDTRHALRRHFKVDAESIAVTALQTLARRGEVPRSLVADAVAKYRIDDVTAAPPAESGGGAA
jgi:pyruvate dehydrogenase E1 component